MSRSIAALLAALSTTSLYAADDTSELWGAWQHHHSFDSQWQLSSDIQLRSQDNGGPWRQLILRPSVTRSLGNGISASLGYAHVENRSLTGQLTNEQRPWQQLQLQQPVGDGQLTQRWRLEQRFLESSRGDFRSDRARFQLRYQHPLTSKDRYVAIHNETFLHLSERDRLNGQSFDQNRLGILTGWRLSPRWALELGYTYLHIGQRDDDRVSHLLNINLITRSTASK